MTESAKSAGAMREALSKEILLGFDNVSGETAAKSGTAEQQKANVAKSGKSAAGKAALRHVLG